MSPDQLDGLVVVARLVVGLLAAAGIAALLVRR